MSAGDVGGNGGWKAEDGSRRENIEHSAFNAQQPMKMDASWELGRRLAKTLAPPAGNEKGR